MKIFIKLIIKILVNNEIKLLAEKSILPEVELAGNNIEEIILNYVSEEFNLLKTACSPSLLSAKIISGSTLFLYYDFYYPKDFVDEKNIDKIVPINGKFLSEDAYEIRQAIQIPPY